LSQDKSKEERQLDKLARGIETRTTAVPENAVKRLEQRIAAEPAYHSVLFKILVFCETPHSLSQLQEAAAAFPEMVNAAHTPSVLLGWLQEAGGMEKVARGRQEETWRTTPAGRRFAQEHAPAKKIAALFAAEPECQGLFKQVLEFCRRPRTLSEIDGLLDPIPRLEELGVRPAFFIERLEDAGGLEWIDKHWCTTQAGTRTP
jgi:hypothetical protein